MNNMIRLLFGHNVQSQCFMRYDVHSRSCLAHQQAAFEYDYVIVDSRVKD
jgi:hypothetical protein